MIVVCLSDIHSDVSRIYAIRRELVRADLVLLAGDITHFGKKDAARMVLESIRHHAARLLAVPGNCDYPDVADLLEEEGISLHGRTVRVEGLDFIGAGCSLPCPGTTPFEISEEEFSTRLQAAGAALPEAAPCVLLAHQPPLDTLNDKILSGLHVGSRSVRAFIEKRRPLACFTGHIHEGRGVDAIGPSRIVNPGPFFKGCYAYAEIDRESARIEIRQA